MAEPAENPNLAKLKSVSAELIKAFTSDVNAGVGAPNQKFMPAVTKFNDQLLAAYCDTSILPDDINAVVNDTLNQLDATNEKLGQFIKNNKLPTSAEAFTKESASAQANILLHNSQLQLLIENSKKIGVIQVLHPEEKTFRSSPSAAPAATPLQSKNQPQSVAPVNPTQLKNSLSPTSAQDNSLFPAK